MGAVLIYKAQVDLGRMQFSLLPLCSLFLIQLACLVPGFTLFLLCCIESFFPLSSGLHFVICLGRCSRAGIFIRLSHQRWVILRVFIIESVATMKAWFSPNKNTENRGSRNDCELITSPVQWDTFITPVLESQSWPSALGELQSTERLCLKKPR